MYYRRMWSTGINRNIVECKGEKVLAARNEEIGINRNIVECKVPLGSAASGTSLVLIETLWNVKFDTVNNFPSARTY